MPSFAMTLPYMRTSPIHVPRRDLVLGRADSLFLRVTVVDSDNPSAQALELSGGIGGPVLQMLVWPDQHYRGAWDYGAYWHWPQCPQTVLWVGTAIIADAAGGVFSIVFPTSTMAGWPRRCAYALQLDYDGGGGSDLLAEGRLQPDTFRGALGQSGHHADRSLAAGADRRCRQRHPLGRIHPMSTTIGGIRIVDMPDLGGVDDTSVHGPEERAGSGPVQRNGVAQLHWRQLRAAVRGRRRQRRRIRRQRDARHAGRHGQRRIEPDRVPVCASRPDLG